MLMLYIYNSVSAQDEAASVGHVAAGRVTLFSTNIPLQEERILHSLSTSIADKLILRRYIYVRAGILGSVARKSRSASVGRDSLPSFVRVLSLVRSAAVGW
jgi:hypothetical protein